jgi:hypothetical protein
MLVDAPFVHGPTSGQAQAPAVPAAALAALEAATRALPGSGDSFAICVRRDLAPGRILVGLLVQGVYAAVAIEAAEDTGLKLLELLGRLVFRDVPAAAARASAHAAALEALATLPPKAASRARRRS